MNLIDQHSVNAAQAELRGGKSGKQIPFFFYALQFAAKKYREKISKIDGQCGGTHNGTVVELNVIWLV